MRADPPEVDMTRDDVMPDDPTTPETARDPSAPASAPTEPSSREPSGGIEDLKAEHRIQLERLNAFYGDNQAVRDVSLAFEPGKVTAIIGPSGCGKSTMVRCVNRMHEEIPGARSEGRVLLDEVDLHDASVDVVAVRRLVGMVFQKPNPFPTMSIADNVAAGPKLTGMKGSASKERVESALQGAGLWNEVKDRLGSPGVGLSGGQQQRLCIARALAVEPDVLLMDEPCSALDPIATLRIEELVSELKDHVTIAIVTHNMQQAARVADTTAFMLSGELVEVGPTEKMFTKPDDDRTEQYVTGKFG
jgi:phosphate transport system ATP-binding protein